MMEEKLKHLEFVQNVISRMNTNSFFIKGWMVTIVAAAFALSAKDADRYFVMIALFAVVVFWAMDAFYLSQERKYRKLYDHVREQQQVDFSMDASGYRGWRRSWLGCGLSKTLGVLYGPMFLITLLVVLYLPQIKQCAIADQKVAAASVSPPSGTPSTSTAPASTSTTPTH